GIVLGAFGFVANEAQSDGSLLGIRLMFSILPAVLAVAGAGFILFYRIDARTISQMEDELAALHEPAPA
ncbi:MAG: MFS transporter, partial [Pseudomonadota bacterium]